ncbi:MAG: hypothetical protein MUE69_07440, partial [Myxococcota bacterium]|nr:hypothetical protein [Myxococcota bacterium]
MRPSSDRAPVAITSATPRPPTTSVPDQSAADDSPTAPSAVAFASACLVAGTDSPLNNDSSTASAVPRRSSRSAGTRSPSAIFTTSPRTSSRPGTVRTTPSRITCARGLDRSRSAAIDF